MQRRIIYLYDKIEKEIKIPMFGKKLKVVITDCNHPSVEIERRILSELNTEVILLNSNKKGNIIKNS